MDIDRRDFLPIGESMSEIFFKEIKLLAKKYNGGKNDMDSVEFICLVMNAFEVILTSLIGLFFDQIGISEKGALELHSELSKGIENNLKETFTLKKIFETHLDLQKIH